MAYEELFTDLLRAEREEDVLVDGLRNCPNQISIFAHGRGLKSIYFGHGWL